MEFVITPETNAFSRFAASEILIEVYRNTLDNNEWYIRTVEAFVYTNPNGT